jgi:hypothetical protein
MDVILKHQFKVAIDSKKESQFQEVVNALFLKRYGNKFVPIKQKHDEGCDGILNNNTVIAAYAPQKANLREFKNKASGDFNSYKDNWQNKYPEWQYVYNGEYTAEMIKHLKDLHSDVQITDINVLIDLIESLPHFKRREIAGYLGINEQYVVNDVMKVVVEDVFKLSEGCGAVKKPHEFPPYIEDKIKLNYDEIDVEDALKEYECVAEYFSQLKDVLKSYQDYEIDALKTKLMDSYKKLSGNFKTRFNNMVDEYSAKNKSDDYYVFFIRVVLIYFFETCIIGDRPESEK